MEDHQPFYCIKDRQLIWVDEGKMDDPDFEYPECPFCKKGMQPMAHSKAILRQKRLRTVQIAWGYLVR